MKTPMEVNGNEREEAKGPKESYTKNCNINKRVNKRILQGNNLSRGRKYARDGEFTDWGGESVSSLNAISYSPESEQQAPELFSQSVPFRLRPLEPLSGGYARTNDDIHRSISLCPAIKTILDTPQMQRLRGLKQLGVSDHVFINATHTRFEHSLGVAHLAEKMCRRLQSRQPRLGIREKDVLCIKIAGLCHDLGHGPFSHVYDGEFRRLLKTKKKALVHQFLDAEEGEFDQWRHEDGSLMMLDAALAHLGLRIDERNLDGPLQQVGDGIKADCFGVYSPSNPLPQESILTSRDMIFVKECILGRPVCSHNDFVGRSWKFEFLYDIVNNRHSGLDVDKMDYYARDRRRALGSGDVDVMLIEEAFVAIGACCNPKDCFRCLSRSHRARENKIHNLLPPKKHLMICYPKKLITKAMDFFKTRFTLHTEVYTHKTGKAVEFMICDILLAADPYLRIPYGPGMDDVERHTINSQRGTGLRISDAMQDPGSYLYLKDTVIDRIAWSDSPELAPARKLVERLRARELYKCVACERMCGPDDVGLWDLTEEEIHFQLTRRSKQEEEHSSDFELQELSEVEEEVQEQQQASVKDNINEDRELNIHPEDLIVELRELHHGKKAENPVNFMRFLSKSEMKRLDTALPHDLPEAKTENEDTYESHIPQRFLERSIRLYCRNASKERVDVFRLRFEKWLEEKRLCRDRYDSLSQQSIW